MARSSVLGLVLCLACNGSIGDPGLDPSIRLPPDVDTVTGEPGVPEGGGFARLSVRELERTLDALFPTLSERRRHFAEESYQYFETERADARIGTAFLDAAVSVADSIAAEAMADAALRAELLDCDETQSALCLENFLATWPVRIIQRDLDADERAAYDALLTQDLGDSADIISVALSGLILHPEFLFRTATGVGDGPSRELVQRELLARLSHFLWGQAPDDALRARAHQGVDLTNADERTEFAREMMDDPRAAEQRSAFHAQWLGYEGLGQAGLGADMWRESNALIERATSAGADYRDLFLSPDTFVSAALAEHYDMSAPEDANGEWVSYGANPRRGILGHGSFLSSFLSLGEGSPTKRGKAVLNRLLCRNVELPDDMDVNIDDGPGEDQCRKEFLQEMHSSGSCAGCHRLLDGIGYGLEIFDAQGAAIETERDKPHCGLDGEGDYGGESFTGASGLAEVLIEDEAHDACVVQHLIHFQSGQSPEESAVGPANVAEITAIYRESGHSYRDLVAAIVRSRAFAEVNLP